VRSLAAGDFILSETRYESEARLPTHAHEHACVVVVLKGWSCCRDGMLGCGA
jgi:hypothetical protein